MPSIQRTCVHCSIVFYGCPSNCNAKFCSSLCYNISRHTSLEQQIARRNIKHKEYYHANKDKHAIRMTRRKAALNLVRINDLSFEQWEEICLSYNYRCAYCGRKPKKLTIDHITPLMDRGDNTLANVVPCCQSCNSRKARGKPLVPVQPLLLTLAKPASQYPITEGVFRSRRHQLLRQGNKRYARGEKQHCAKLTPENVIEIRRRYSPGNGTALAKEFGVTQSNVSMIIHRQTWTHI